MYVLLSVMYIFVHVHAKSIFQKIFLDILHEYHGKNNENYKKYKKIEMYISKMCFNKFILLYFEYLLTIGKNVKYMI